MKPSDVTEPGYYWLHDGREWSVAEVRWNAQDTVLVVWHTGNECEDTLDQLERAGYTFGPRVEPPPPLVIVSP